MAIKATVGSNNPSANLGDGIVEINDPNNPNTPIRKRSGKYDCIVPDPVPISYNYGYFTGQKTIYALRGDDGFMLANFWKPLITAGSIPLGKISRLDPDDYTMLLDNNIHGNKERFTNDLGIRETNVDNLPFDHWTGHMVGRSAAVGDDWTTQVQTTGLGTDFGGTNTTGGFTDWFLPNALQADNMRDFDNGTIGLEYLNFPVVLMFTSTTSNNTPTHALTITNVNQSTAIAKTSTFLRTIFIRKAL